MAGAGLRQLGLDLRLPSEGSVVPTLPQVSALGLHISSLLGATSDPFGSPCLISSQLPWTDLRALTLSDDTASGHNISASATTSSSLIGDAPHHLALPSQQGKFALSSLVSLAPQFSALSLPEGTPRPPLPLRHFIIVRRHLYRLPLMSSAPRRPCRLVMIRRLIATLCIASFSPGLS